jgi:hypothetical protein
VRFRANGILLERRSEDPESSVLLELDLGAPKQGTLTVSACVRLREPGASEGITLRLRACDDDSCWRELSTAMLLPGGAGLTSVVDPEWCSRCLRVVAHTEGQEEPSAIVLDLELMLE